MLALGEAACGYDDGNVEEGPTRPGARPDAGPGGGGLDAAGAPACSNGIDDDCDGLIDFAGGDPGCASASDDSERGLGLACDDGLDNDGDGAIDYVVPGCGLTVGDSGCTSPHDLSEVDGPGPI